MMETIYLVVDPELGVDNVIAAFTNEEDAQECAADNYNFLVTTVYLEEHYNP